jgi:hypothetical protein
MKASITDPWGFPVASWNEPRVLFLEPLMTNDDTTRNEEITSCKPATLHKVMKSPSNVRKIDRVARSNSDVQGYVNFLLGASKLREEYIELLLERIDLLNLELDNKDLLLDDVYDGIMAERANEELTKGNDIRT